jgi:hypothetical protein
MQHNPFVKSKEKITSNMGRRHVAISNKFQWWLNDRFSGSVNIFRFSHILFFWLSDLCDGMGCLMNSKVTIMQSVDWNKYSLEEWLYQFGAWQHSSAGTCGRSINPIAVAMDEAVVKRKAKKITSKEQIIADWINDDSKASTPKKNKYCCEISDNEARAVQRLILDMQGTSDILDEWLDAIIDRYFYGNSWAEMVIKVGLVANPTIIRTQHDAREDVRCGLAAMHCRYPFIRFDLKNRDK